MPRPLFWEIVGGADKGGILVREGESIKSAQLDERDSARSGKGAGEAPGTWQLVDRLWGGGLP